MFNTPSMIFMKGGYFEKLKYKTCFVEFYTLFVFFCNLMCVHTRFDAFSNKLYCES